MSEEIKYGVLSYDIPKESKSAYKRIKTIISGRSVMQTWSCYLIPWGVSGMLQRALENEQLKTPGLSFRILPFHESASEDVEAEASASLGKMLSDLRQKLDLAIYEFEQGITDDPKTTRSCIKSLKRKVEEAKQIRVVFTLTDDLVAAMAAYETLIQGAKDQLMDALKRKIKVEDETAKAETEKPEATTATPFDRHYELPSQ